MYLLAKEMAKKFLPKKIINAIRPYYKQLQNFYVLSNQYGQFSSIKKWSCIDKANNPIPWYTYPTIEYLSNLDFSDKVILEWGGGQSSLFWAKRCKKLVTIESNPDWFKIIAEKKMKNQDVYLKTSIVSKDSVENYGLFPQTLECQFDVIIVDGATIDGKTTRPICLNTAMKIIKNNGMIIFDNSDWYPDTCYILRKHGFIQIDFHGFAPINTYTHTTSLFLTREFNFQPLNNYQPHYSKSAIQNKNDLLGWEN